MVIVDSDLFQDRPRSQHSVRFFCSGRHRVPLVVAELLKFLRANPSILSRPDDALRDADDKGIPYVAIIGGNEISTGTVMIKDMKTGEQKAAKQEELLSVFS